MAYVNTSDPDSVVAATRAQVSKTQVQNLARYATRARSVEKAITPSTRDSATHSSSRLPSTQCDGTEHVAPSISLSGICLSWWVLSFDSERSKEIEIITTGLDWGRTQQYLTVSGEVDRQPS